MATIKTITIEYQLTFNLGNYSSVRPSVAITAELAEGENVEAVTQSLQDQARQEVENEIDRTLTQQGRAPHFEQLRNKAKAPADEIEVPF